MINRTHPRKWQAGTSLLELLVAVVVLSVGLLGVAALQAVSLANNTNAYQRTQAVNFTYELMDRIRASRLLMLATGMPTNLEEQWAAEVAAVLPDGDLEIIQNGESFTVTVTWIDDRRAEDPGTGEDPREASFTVTSII